MIPPTSWIAATTPLAAVRVTPALTLFTYHALGYTLNRITLFAPVAAAARRLEGAGYAVASEPDGARCATDPRGTALRLVAASRPR